jgi:hypothetical protein
VGLTPIFRSFSIVIPSVLEALFSRKAMNIDYTLFSNTQLFGTIEKLMVRAGKDEALRAELAAQLENIYNTLADPSFREYGKRVAEAMAASRTFVGPSHHYRNEGWVH